MLSRLILMSFTFGLALLPSTVDAAFVVTVDQSDLKFTGPGTHEVDLFLAFQNTGNDRTPELDGLQFDITNAPNAVVKQGPVTSGITGQGFPAFVVNSGNRFNWGGLGNFTVPTDPGVLLTTLTFDVADSRSFTIGLDFVDATRSFASIAAGPSDFSVPSSFTVTAIPEPSSLAFLMAIGTVCVAGRRKRRLA